MKFLNLLSLLTILLISSTSLVDSGCTSAPILSCPPNLTLASSWDCYISCVTSIGGGKRVLQDDGACCKTDNSNRPVKHGNCMNGDCISTDSEISKDEL